MIYKIIENVKGCQFATLKTLTEVKIPKKWGIVGIVTKLAVSNVQVNYDYETAVNNRLEKKGLPRSFSADSLPWGKWEIKNKIIEHKGELYLRYYCVKGEREDATYFVNGREATAEELATIKAYNKSKSKGSAKQSAEGLTENQVYPKNVNFSNILALNVNGEQYTKGQLRLVA